MFNTIIPQWQAGDTFLAGEKLQKLRIAAIDSTIDPDEARETFDAVWIVEARRLRSRAAQPLRAAGRER